jgi:flagellar motor switch protein FliM
VALDRVLSQEEIDNVFRNIREHSHLQEDPSTRAQPYDFRRPDRIGKDQLRAIHLLHENFARSLASSLSAYLRAYVSVNLVSVEQLSFMEFVQCLPSPTIITPLAMKPFDGNAILEMNPTLVFPILEMLLGGNGKGMPHKVDREITEIEQSILEAVYRLILQDMREAWASVTDFNFAIVGTETEPQMLNMLAPNEAVVAVSLEVRLVESIGMMNFGIPSIIIKMLRQRFDSQWIMRKSEPSEEEQTRIFRLLQPAQLRAEARLEGPTIRTEDLLKLEVGDVLKLDYSLNRPLRMELNGINKWEGQIVQNGTRRCFLASQPSVPDPA